MKIDRGAASLLLALALFGVTGCGASGGEPEQGSGEPAQSEPEMTSHESMSGEPSSDTGNDAEASGEVVITVENFQYDIPESVSPGATITVVNKDSAPHTVTSEEEGIFDAVFEGGETVTFTAPEEPGEYPFFCVYHPDMTGTLVVK
jgi:plastocyanin